MVPLVVAAHTSHQAQHNDHHHQGAGQGDGEEEQATGVDSRHQQDDHSEDDVYQTADKVVGTHLELLVSC